MTSDTHDEAVHRLEAALVTESRLGDRFQAAVGTSTEFGAFARLSGARDEVSAQQAWLDETDEEDQELEDEGRVWINGHPVGGAGSIFAGR
jgi:hypothetical protein